MTKGRSVVQNPGGGHRWQPQWANVGGRVERFRQIERYVTGRSVLDIGCASGYRRPDWVHRYIADAADSVLGVDIDARAVADLREDGYKVVLADVQDMDLERTFEVVHAGEVIEHLENPAGFLRTARDHLTASGELIITTPNPFAVSNFIYRLGEGVRVNSDHTMWFCEHTLPQLLERCGFEAVEVTYLSHTTPGVVRRLLAWIMRAVLPERLKWNTLLVVAKLRE